MSVYNQTPTKIVEYEDTFSTTILTDFTLVAAVVLIFGLLKSAFSSYYMPVLQTNKRGWMKDIFRMPLDKYAQRGNMPLLFIVFQTLLLKTLLFVLLVAVLILFPVYACGNSQDSPKNTMWKYLEISNVDRNSALIIFPALGSIFVTIYMMQFYVEFSQIQVYYKQLILRRASPNNFCVLIDNIPKQLRTYQKLKDTLESYYDHDELCKIIPIPINNFRLYNAYKKLSKVILKEHQISSQLYYLKSKQQSLKVKLIEGNKWLHSILYKQTNKSFRQAQKKYFHLQQESNRIKSIIEKFRKAEDIDISYLQNISQLIPPFPAVVTSFRLIDKAEDDAVNPVKISRQGHRDFERGYGSTGDLVQDTDKDQMDRQISGCCFCVFKSQKSAAIASQVSLLADNLEPYIYQAPHYQDIIWRNLNSGRFISIVLYLAFWLAVITVLFIFFIPQFAILRLIDQNSQSWYEFIYTNMCYRGGKCPADVKINEGTTKQLGLSCFVCHKVSSMMITYIGTIVSAIFLSILPQIINLLTLIPRFRTKSQRSIYKFICLFIFLFLIQGIMALFFGGATTSEGVLNIQSVLNESLEDLVEQIAKNASSQSFVFLNYVATKYFFFNILDLVRVRHIFPTIKRLLTNKDLISKSQVFNYNDYDYPIQLSYYIHMVSVGLTYMFINPLTIPVICIALLTMVAVGRYNILFVFKQNASSDLSGRNDIFKHALNCVFIGILLNVATLLSYVIIIHQRFLTFYLIVQSIQILYMIVVKLIVDQRFNKSKEYLNLGTFVSSNQDSNEIINRLKIVHTNYMINASIVTQQYLSVKANQQSLENYMLTQDDVNNISACYTNPAVALCAVYPRESDDWFVL